MCIPLWYADICGREHKLLYSTFCYIQLGGFQKIPQFFTQSDQHSSTNMPARGTMAADDDHFDEEVCEELSLELVAQELPLDPVDEGF